MEVKVCVKGDEGVWRETQVRVCVEGDTGEGVCGERQR